MLMNAERLYTGKPQFWQVQKPTAGTIAKVADATSTLPAGTYSVLLTSVFANGGESSAGPAVAVTTMPSPRIYL
jgi:hypothetical protein